MSHAGIREWGRRGNCGGEKTQLGRHLGNIEILQDS